MSLSLEFKDFYSAWMTKAKDHDHSLASAFDRFYTLYVVYNRLYAEATFVLARNGGLNLSGRNTFPDSKAATDYVVQFVGGQDIVASIENDLPARVALQRIVSGFGTFHVCLDMVTGEPLPEADENLRNRLESANNATKAKAIAETVYKVRCNTFHGHKEFNEVQRELLEPICVILEKLIECVYGKLTLT